LTKVYVSYGDDRTSLSLALIWSPQGTASEPVDSTSTYAGLAVSVPDRSRVREQLIGAGCDVVDPIPVAGPVTRSFGTDPDGNGFEFGEFAHDATESAGSLPGFGLFVRDLEKSVDFYTRLLGMRESGRIESSSGGADPSDPLNGMTKVYFTYGEDPAAPMLSLIWSPDATASDPVDTTSTYAGLAICVPDVSRLREQLIAAGCEVSDLMPASGQSATRALAIDPDGNNLELVEFEDEAKGE
jgi:catechol 2,3-dioxygenase-like lactoylglutathione lyase family enzyme